MKIDHGPDAADAASQAGAGQPVVQLSSDGDGGRRTSSVTIEGSTLGFAAAFDEPILDSALRAGVPLPHQCRGASCGTCKCEVLAGEVEHGWSLGLALSDEEQAAGFCLACQARPKSPAVHLRPVQPMPLESSILESEATVLALTAVTPRVRRLVVALPPGCAMAYRAGMYAQLRLPGVTTDRCYSFVTPDGGDGLLTFWIALHPQGQASAVMRERLAVGDIVGVRGPYGTCALAPARQGGCDPVLALAAGTGLAPIHAILAQALQDGLSDSVLLLCSVREHAELLGLAELERLARQYQNFRYAYTATDAPSPLAAHREALPDLLPRLVSDLGRHRLLISGSPGFVEACRRQAIELGADPGRIGQDSFTPAT